MTESELRRLAPGMALADREVLGAIEAVFPVIELHHFVMRSPRPSPLELIAGNGMHAGLVLAEEEVGSRDGGGLSIRINDTVAGAVADPWTMGGTVLGIGRFAE